MRLGERRREAPEACDALRAGPRAGWKLNDHSGGLSPFFLSVFFTLAFSGLPYVSQARRDPGVWLGPQYGEDPAGDPF